MLPFHILAYPRSQYPIPVLSPHAPSSLFFILDTTRSPRKGEENGKQYYFTTKENFKDLIQKGSFIEHAEFSGNYYGTSFMTVQDVSKSGRRCLLDIEAQVRPSSPFSLEIISFEIDPSATHFSPITPLRSTLSLAISLRSSHLNPVYLFISPPSLPALRDRLKGRGTETEEAVTKRLATALKEVEYAKTPGAHDIVIVNDDLDRAYDLFKKVALGEPIQGDNLPLLED
ncbi:hypothetical protein NLI96_g5343 [Meripilus lineatus]|uniref:Guanylate kinase-like domain-containing protein n=1 Tax=Meripilus lineatus TaxID=2056292 RepID=A0AAD5V8H6_9APHY|nr:hypothetical protein NLI96_g5343 [Physisporinus lineatus]